MTLRCFFRPYRTVRSSAKGMASPKKTPCFIKKLTLFAIKPDLQTSSYGAQRAKKIKQRYREMQASATLADLAKIPAASLHPLSGDRQGQWTVKVTGNDRLCFILEHNPLPLKEDGGIDMEAVTDVCIVEIVDYH